ncbi:NAD(P)-dependent dehydrogenase (short-subunit alcohol dehydrogenase family) [Oxalobacteraceae bacterium GrIS 2.11]
MNAKNSSTANAADKNSKPVWFITGCSTGFGKALTTLALERGYRVVATARNTDDIEEFTGQGDVLLLKLDVTDSKEIKHAVKKALHHFGRIDVLVNNAGIGYFGAIEESDHEQVRKMFDINVFGVCSMTDAVLPGMRENRSGFIVNISSIGGLCSAPGVGYYNATKYALEGLSEALRGEVEPLGIKVMTVEPSGFRTDWAGRSANESKHLIEDYAATAGANRLAIRAISGKQHGDPVRAVQAIIEAVEAKAPPQHLLLGNDAVDSALAKLGRLKKEFSLWEKVSRGADFPVEV